MSFISIKIHIQICWIKLNFKIFREICFYSMMKGIQGGAGVELSDLYA